MRGPAGAAEGDVEPVFPFPDSDELQPTANTAAKRISREREGMGVTLPVAFNTGWYTLGSMAKKGAAKEAEGPKSIQNRRARYDYEIVQSYEAGMVLVGSEVKSLYLGRANLTDAYCRVKDGELWLHNLDIEPYSHATVFQHERRRDRKLLMHRKEIDLLERRSLEKGFGIIPLAIYFKNGRAKIEVGLGRGKASYDKRDKIAKDETRREVERARKLRD